MKNILVIIGLLAFLAAQGQKIRPENYRYFDNKRMHFGFLFGYNSSGALAVPNFMPGDSLAGIDVKPRPGFHLGVVTSLTLHPMLKLRLIPSLSFQERAYDYRFVGVDGTVYNYVTVDESTSLDFPLYFKFKAYRISNFSIFALFGAQYSLNLSSNFDKSMLPSDPFLRLSPHDGLGLVGGGIDLYFEYFKMSFEIKFTHSFINPVVEEDSFYNSRTSATYNKTWFFSLTFEG